MPAATLGPGDSPAAAAVLQGWDVCVSRIPAGHLSPLAFLLLRRLHHKPRARRRARLDMPLIPLEIHPPRGPHASPSRLHTSSARCNANGIATVKVRCAPMREGPRDKSYLR